MPTLGVLGVVLHPHDFVQPRKNFFAVGHVENSQNFVQRNRHQAREENQRLELLEQLWEVRLVVGAALGSRGQNLRLRVQRPVNEFELLVLDHNVLERHSIDGEAFLLEAREDADQEVDQVPDLHLLEARFLQRAGVDFVGERLFPGAHFEVREAGGFPHVLDALFVGGGLQARNARVD